MTAAKSFFPRLCYAAAHVVMKDDYASVPHSFDAPGTVTELGSHIDWEATIEYRRYLDSHGFGIAEAMDTAQRFSIGWDNAYRLIRECGALDLSVGMIAGAGTDHLEHIGSADELINGVVFQAKKIQEAGGDVIILPMAWLTEHDADEDTYVNVYRSIVDQLEGPLYVHWLGEMFASNLAGYFPGDSFYRVMSHAPSKVRGAKLSLLDAEFEIEARTRLLNDEQFILTGDDFHFASLIRGTGDAPMNEISINGRPVGIGDFSHALLGIFDGIAVPVSRAMKCLAEGDVGRYDALMAPCEVLGQCIFQTPTQFYKSGLAFLSWLNGHQGNRILINHEESMRDAAYYEDIYALAVKAQAISDVELAEERMKEWRSTNS